MTQEEARTPRYSSQQSSDHEDQADSDSASIYASHDAEATMVRRSTDSTEDSPRIRLKVERMSSDGSGHGQCSSPGGGSGLSPRWASERTPSERKETMANEMCDNANL